MTSGTPVAREFVFVMDDGGFAVDWGDGVVQDIFSGEFIRIEEAKFGHPATDLELDRLIKSGRVSGYDARTVYLLPLPEGKRKTLD